MVLGGAVSYERGTPVSSAVVLILLDSGISPSALSATSAGVARSASTALGDPQRFRDNAADGVEVNSGGGSRGVERGGG